MKSYSAMIRRGEIAGCVLSKPESKIKIVTPVPLYPRACAFGTSMRNINSLFELAPNSRARRRKE